MRQILASVALFIVILLIVPFVEMTNSSLGNFIVLNSPLNPDPAVVDALEATRPHGSKGYFHIYPGMYPNLTFIFIHLSKTGGTTFIKTLNLFNTTKNCGLYIACNWDLIAKVAQL